MSDIYLSLTETPSVVTLSQPIIASSVAATVTVGNTVTVALDANSLSALENVTVTVGAAVSVSNFPASQTIAGSVTVNNFPSTQTIAGTVTAGNFPVITDGEGDSITKGVPIAFYDGSSDIRKVVGDGQPLPVEINPTGTIPQISGTVTANANLQNSNSVAQAFIDESNSYGSLSVVLSGAAGNIGVVGTVTAAAPNGSLTTRFGTPTTANVSFATAAVTKSDRKYLLIQNVTTGSNVITVGIGFTPTTTQGIQLTAGAGITFESSYIPTGAVYVLSSVTASNFTILEA